MFCVLARRASRGFRQCPSNTTACKATPRKQRRLSFKTLVKLLRASEFWTIVQATNAFSRESFGSQAHFWPHACHACPPRGQALPSHDRDMHNTLTVLNKVLVPTRLASKRLRALCFAVQQAIWRCQTRQLLPQTKAAKAVRARLYVKPTETSSASLSGPRSHGSGG